MHGKDDIKIPNPTNKGKIDQRFYQFLRYLINLQIRYRLALKRDSSFSSGDRTRGNIETAAHVAHKFQSLLDEIEEELRNNGKNNS